jgi:hypothetical protein
MVDGSTRFVAEEIDLATYRALATRASGEPPSDFWRGQRAGQG